MDDLVYHRSLVAFHKNQLDRRADDMPLNNTALYQDGEDRPFDVLRQGEISDDQGGTATTNASSCERRSNQL